MWELLKKIVKDISTGIDGKTYCCARVMGHMGIVVYLGLAISTFYISHTFNYVAFGTGFGAIIGSVGGAIWAKQDSEPKG